MSPATVTFVEAFRDILEHFHENEINISTRK